MLAKQRDDHLSFLSVRRTAEETQVQFFGQLFRIFDRDQPLGQVSRVRFEKVKVA